MCLDSAKKKRERERNNNVGKNKSIDDKLQRNRKKKRFSYLMCLCVWNMTDNLTHTSISHDDLRLDSSIFEKFIDVIIIKLEILKTQHEN